MNNVSLVGRLARDPEVTTLKSGIKKVRFTLAVDKDYGDNETNFISCVAWKNQADFVGTYIKKGYLVSVQGRIETGSYEKDGRTVFTTDVVASRVAGLQSKAEIDRMSQGTTQQAPAQTQQQAPAPQAPAQTETNNVQGTAEVPWNLDL